MGEAEENQQPPAQVRILGDLLSEVVDQLEVPADGDRGAVNHDGQGFLEVTAAA
ncbi:hypothetical protein [Kutzneria albida]|uniref:hypothetical protein n=1 Tax=Kutzneria albida TaxID=43357 RepID=UPI001F3522A0|nr:hypothetical protein [Kutzneria albida]